MLDLRALVLGAALAAASSISNAAVPMFTGNIWMQMCEKYVGNESDSNDMICEAFIQGTVEGYFHGFTAGQIGIVPDDKASVAFCFSNQVTIGQIVKIVRKDLQDHPQLLDSPISMVLGVSLKNKFPCKQ